ncbi:MAG: ABC transporter permease subunit [Clostridia bacterium]|nr:ABC transporter permease subunit [Clostridia bacterium]
MKKVRPVARWYWLLILLLVWELTARFSGISPLLLPTVESVAVTLFRELFTGTLGLQLLMTIGMILLSLVCSALLALALTLLSRHFSGLAGLFDTLSAILHPLPGVALLPLLVIWFGTGTASVFAVMLHACLWSMFISLQDGFAAVPPIYERVGRNLSMSRLRVELEILLPASASAVLSGLRIGWARAWRALISAEMVFGAIGQLGGIGWYLFRQRAFMNTSGLFAGLVCVMAIGYAVETLAFGALEKHTVLKWGGEHDAASR